jgi:hypothetical protein
MGSGAVEQRKEAFLSELARGWGKIFAVESFGPEGPDLTVDFQQIEDLAGLGVQALVQGVVREAGADPGGGSAVPDLSGRLSGRVARAGAADPLRGRAGPRAGLSLLPLSAGFFSLSVRC